MFKSLIGSLFSYFLVGVIYCYKRFSREEREGPQEKHKDILPGNFACPQKLKNAFLITLRVLRALRG
jgi:hypothetical protein